MADEKRLLKLEDGLHQMAIIRTTFETLDHFPGDPEMRPELLEIIEQARFELAEWLYAFTWELENHPDDFATDFYEMRDLLLGMATQDTPGMSINRMMRVSSFPNGPWRFPLPEGLSVDEAQGMPGVPFLVRLLRDFHTKVTDRAYSVNLPTFEAAIFQPYLALMFVNYATTDPLLYLPPE